MVTKYRLLFLFIGSVFLFVSFSACLEKDPEGYPEEVGYLNVNPEDLPSFDMLVRNGDWELIKALVEKEPEREVSVYELQEGLIGAIETNRKDIATYLLKKGADINESGCDYLSPLECAVENDKKEMLAFLIKNGARLDEPESAWETPLTIAVKKRDITSVRFLLSKGADVNAGPILPLHYAAHTGDKEMMRLLIKYGAKVNVKLEPDGDTPLCLAVKNGDIASIRFLLKKGADVNQKGKYKISPLHYAVSGGDHEIIKLLVEQGADLNVTTNAFEYGPCTPACLAVGNDDIIAMNYLVEKGAVLPEDGTLLRFAVYGDKFETFQYVLDKIQIPLTVWERGEIWQTALENDNWEVARYMVETWNMDINEKLNNEKRPLEIVAANRKKKGTEAAKNKMLLTWLFEKGADPLLLHTGVKVMEWVIRESNPETFDYFCEQGLDWKGLDLLYKALDWRYFHKARYLLKQKGADYFFANYISFPEPLPLLLYYAGPLYAQWEGQASSDILEFLIDEKVNTDYFPHAFSQCVKYNDFHSVIHLLRNGVDINVKNSHGLNALWSVREPEMAEYLILHGIDVSIPLTYEHNLIPMAVLSTFEKYGIPIRLSPEDMNKALATAARLGNDRMVDYFIRKGADLNGEYNQTPPLIENARQGYERCTYTRKISPKVIRQLIKAGADINAEDEKGRTALEYALGSSPCRVDGWYYGREYVGYERYPKQDHSLLAIELIKAGADVNRCNKEGDTPLSLAIENKYEDVVPLLLEYGADVNRVSKNGYSPLLLAIENRCERIIPLLLEYGADIYFQAATGEHCLSLAAVRSTQQTIQLLKDAVNNND